MSNRLSPCRGCGAGMPPLTDEDRERGVLECHFCGTPKYVQPKIDWTDKVETALHHINHLEKHTQHRNGALLIGDRKQ